MPSNFPISNDAEKTNGSVSRSQTHGEKGASQMKSVRGTTPIIDTIPPAAVTTPPVTTTPVNLKHKLSLFTQHWCPKIVGQMDNYDIKVVKLLGDFVWHKHDSDELFFVVQGELVIKMRYNNNIININNINKAGDNESSPQLVERSPQMNSQVIENSQLTEKDVILKPGEFYVIPAGIEHKPVAVEEVHAVLLELKGTLNTGDAENTEGLEQKVLENI